METAKTQYIKYKIVLILNDGVVEIIQIVVILTAGRLESSKSCTICIIYGAIIQVDTQRYNNNE